MECCKVCRVPNDFQKFTKVFDRNGIIATQLFYVCGIVTDESGAAPVAVVCDNCKNRLELAYKVRKAATATDRFFSKITINEPTVIDCAVKLETIFGEADEKDKLQPWVPPVPPEEESFYEDFYTNDDRTFDDDDSWENFEAFAEPEVELKPDDKDVDVVTDDHWKISETKSAATEVVKKVRKKRQIRAKDKEKVSAGSAVIEIGEAKIAKQKLKIEQNATDETVVGKSFTKRVRNRRNGRNKYNEGKDFIKLRDGNFSCTKCDKQCNNSIAISTHVRVEHDSTHELCQDCGKEFKISGTFARHYWMCGGKSQRSFHCDLCGKVRASHNSIKSHIQNVHMKSEKPFKCNLCWMQFKHERGLYDHLRIHEMKATNKFPHHCEHCGKGFVELASLKTHLTTGTRCTRVTGIKSSHVVETVPIVNCAKCTRIFKSQEELAEHVQGIHDKVFPFRCPLCNKGLSSKYSLTTHIDSHNNVKKFVCNYPGCDRKFVRKGQIKGHQKFHLSDEKEFECHICLRKFRLKQTLNNHLMVHSDEKKHQCQIENCGRRFRDGYNLKCHLKKFHKIEVPSR